jgi:hypothetical protein
LSRLSTDKVEVVSIGRELYSEVLHRLGRHDLSVAIGGNVPQPQAVLAFVLHYAEDVFTVGRDGDQTGFAGLRNLVDRRILKRNKPGTGNVSINAIGGRRHEQNDDHAGNANAELVLACGGHDSRTATDVRGLGHGRRRVCRLRDRRDLAAGISVTP